MTTTPFDEMTGPEGLRPQYRLVREWLDGSAPGYGRLLSM